MTPPFCEAESELTGSASRPELGAELRTYHLRHSRKRAKTAHGRVHEPRHLLVYRLGGDGMVEIARILHEAMDLRRYVPPYEKG